MTAILKALCIVWLFCLCLVLPATAQQPQTPRSATATPVVPSTGAPTTIQIKKNVLNQQIRALNSQIQVAKRCIANATRTGVLFDFEGNRNIVPSTDAINCTRTLNALLRQLASLNVQTTAVAQDAQREAAFLQTQQKQKTLQAQTSAKTKLLRRRGRAH